METSMIRNGSWRKPFSLDTLFIGNKVNAVWSLYKEENFSPTMNAFYDEKIHLMVRRWLVEMHVSRTSVNL